MVIIRRVVRDSWLKLTVTIWLHEQRTHNDCAVFPRNSCAWLPAKFATILSTPLNLFTAIHPFNFVSLQREERHAMQNPIAATTITNGIGAITSSWSITNWSRADTTTAITTTTVNGNANTNRNFAAVFSIMATSLAREVATAWHRPHPDRFIIQNSNRIRHTFRHTSISSIQMATMTTTASNWINTRRTAFDRVNGLICHGCKRNCIRTLSTTRCRRTSKNTIAEISSLSVCWRELYRRCMNKRKLKAHISDVDRRIATNGSKWICLKSNGDQWHRHCPPSCHQWQSQRRRHHQHP